MSNQLHRLVSDSEQRRLRRIRTESRLIEMDVDALNLSLGQRLQFSDDVTVSGVWAAVLYIEKFIQDPPTFVNLMAKWK